ncbi:MAG: hypothetical protein H0T89_10945 [Deltaproteobacteria bacterium]|nr:hypothetical protein [Deltaproteobacteria bacterium]MDQ3298567.1 hypothetical protein [Myxococcota bacterium]
MSRVLVVLGAPLRVGLVAGLVSIAIGAGCSKSAGTKEKPDEAIGVGDKIAVPKGGAEGGEVATGAPREVVKVDETRFRLSAEEGQLAIENPAGVKAGSESVVRIVVTPGSEYKVNTEFPTKLTLETPQGVTIAKAEQKAGGHDKAKGDADKFEESGLAFLVKVTPSQSGSYTINGSFKFAVCDKAGSTCLAKKEPIAIQVAAQ